MNISPAHVATTTLSGGHIESFAHRAPLRLPHGRPRRQLPCESLEPTQPAPCAAASAASSASRSSRRRCWRSVGASWLSRKIAPLIAATILPSSARSRACCSTDDRGARPITRSRAASSVLISLSVSIHGGAMFAFRSIRCASAQSPAALSSSSGSRSPRYGRSSKAPFSAASRSWRSIRLSREGGSHGFHRSLALSVIAPAS